MKTFLTILTIIFFTTPVMAEEGTADGKGIYCPTVRTCQGYWFKNGAATCFFILKFEVYESDETKPYSEDGLSNLILYGSKKLDRQTLILTYEDGETTHQCHLVNSPEELRQKIQAIIDAAKDENKL